MFVRPSICIPLSASLLLLDCTTAYPAEQLDTLYTSLRMLWGLLIVIAIILILYFILKKRFSIFKQQEHSHIKIVEIKHVTPKKSLMLVEVKGQDFLVGTGSDSINSIIPIQKNHSFDSVLEQSEKNCNHDT